MGMYTSMAVELAIQGPVLEFMDWWATYPRGDCPGFPDHPLFVGCDSEDEEPATTGASRWYALLWSPDYSGRFREVKKRFGINNEKFLPLWERRGGIGVLRAVSSIKNYGGEINMFLNWITPYVREGWAKTQYEESVRITNYVFANGAMRSPWVTNQDLVGVVWPN